MDRQELKVDSCSLGEWNGYIRKLCRVFIQPVIESVVWLTVMSGHLLHDCT